MDKAQEILVDWLAFSIQNMQPYEVIELLGLQGQSFTPSPARYFYKQAESFGNIHIYFDGRNDDMGITVEMSGQGCREYEQYGNGDFAMLFAMASRDDINISRLDIAHDEKAPDHSQGLYDIHNVANKVLNGEYVSYWKKYKVEYSDEGTSVTLGSRSSETYCRIYDKAAERKVEGHWNRFETVFKQERAMEVARIITEYNGLPQHIYFGIVSHYLNFVEPSQDSNKSRWPVSNWWLELLQGATERSIFTKRNTEYNLSKKIENFMEQYSQFVQTAIINIGIDNFLEKVVEGNYIKKKYRDLLNLYGISEHIIDENHFIEIKRKLEYLIKIYGGKNEKNYPHHHMPCYLDLCDTSFCV